MNTATYSFCNVDNHGPYANKHGGSCEGVGNGGEGEKNKENAGRGVGKRRGKMSGGRDKMRTERS